MVGIASPWGWAGENSSCSARKGEMLTSQTAKGTKVEQLILVNELCGNHRFLDIKFSQTVISRSPSQPNTAGSLLAFKQISLPFLLEKSSQIIRKIARKQPIKLGDLTDTSPLRTR